MIAKMNEPETTTQPTLSIVSPSLNTGRYLRETIESIFNQTFKDFEYIVIDGGSTDETLSILKEYPQIRWLSEKEQGDNGILDAIWKGFHMSRGKYFTYICISDGFHDRDWLKECVRVLDADHQVSAVWGIHQEISEDSHLGKVAWPEHLNNHPFQRMEFLPFWFAMRQDIEIATIFRRDVFEICYPRNHQDELFRFSPHCALNYNFNTKGYLPYFLPILSFYARTHKLQRQEKNYEVLDALSKKYDLAMKEYREKMFSGQIVHRFLDGSSQSIMEVSPDQLRLIRQKYREYRFKRRLDRTFQKILRHL